MMSLSTFVFLMAFEDIICNATYWFHRKQERNQAFDRITKYNNIQ
jgi:hypothetical protein